MKVGILTFHDGFNHGAFLQAFALQRTIAGLGHDCVVINYKNRLHRWRENIRPFYKFRRPTTAINWMQKARAFRRDQAAFHCGPLTTRPLNVLKTRYDAIVVGSDVVWDYRLFGYDDLYFGGANAERMIAYAPSFGGISPEAQVPDAIRAGLRRFDTILVRDEHTRTIVQACVGHDVDRAVDPALLYDFSGHEQATRRIDHHQPFLLVYAYAVQPEGQRELQQYARAHNLALIAVGYPQPWCDRSFVNVGPFEWLAWFRQAHAIVSSTFHGCVFALKYGRPLAVNMTETIRHKVPLLLSDIGLEDRVVLSHTTPAGAFEASRCEPVQDRIMSMAEESLSKLKDALA